MTFSKKLNYLSLIFGFDGIVFGSFFFYYAINYLIFNSKIVSPTWIVIQAILSIICFAFFEIEIIHKDVKLLAIREAMPQ